jgi:hypothetical protein
MGLPICPATVLIRILMVAFDGNQHLVKLDAASTLDVDSRIATSFSTDDTRGNCSKRGNGLKVECRFLTSIRYPYLRLIRRTAIKDQGSGIGVENDSKPLAAYMVLPVLSNQLTSALANIAIFVHAKAKGSPSFHWRTSRNGQLCRPSVAVAPSAAAERTAAAGLANP